MRPDGRGLPYHPLADRKSLQSQVLWILEGKIADIEDSREPVELLLIQMGAFENPEHS